jgi:hypothetical protein
VLGKKPFSRKCKNGSILEPPQPEERQEGESIPVGEKVKSWGEVVRHFEHSRGVSQCQPSSPCFTYSFPFFPKPQKDGVQRNPAKVPALVENTVSRRPYLPATTTF